MADYNSSYAGAQIDSAVGTVLNGSKLLPAGGTAGQVLMKDSNSDYDVVWGDIDRTPVSIAVTTNPTKMTYEQLEEFDPTGMVVTCTFTDGGTRVLLNSTLTFNPSTFASTGSNTVTISAVVEGFTLTTTLTVTVTAITIDSWAKAFQVGRSGVANQIMQVGDTINGTYTVGGSVYTCPWIVMDFRDAELENGTIYHNAPIIQMHYTNHDNVAYDPAETTEATEQTAQAGFYYVGYDGTNYTLLSLAAGDTIPYASYTTVYKTIYNSVNAVRYGDSEWQYSWMRQYLNHAAAGYAVKQHDCDVLPANALTTAGFMSYLESEMTSEMHQVKISTKQATYTGGSLIDTYDYFFPLSISEMNMKDNNASPDDGEPTPFYKQLLNSNTKVNVGTYAALIKYAVNGTTSAQNAWLRSAYLGSVYEWVVASSGNVNNGYPSDAIRVAPACFLV